MAITFFLAIFITRNCVFWKCEILKKRFFDDFSWKWWRGLFWPRFSRLKRKKSKSWVYKISKESKFRKCSKKGRQKRDFWLPDILLTSRYFWVFFKHFWTLRLDQLPLEKFLKKYRLLKKSCSFSDFKQLFFNNFMFLRNFFKGNWCVKNFNEYRYKNL